MNNLNQTAVIKPSCFTLEDLSKGNLIESGLIKVYKTDTGEFIVDGRELWKGLGSKQEFTNWVKSRLQDCDAVENEDYSSFDKTIKREKGASVLNEYILKLDLAKEMAMLERNELGKQYRRYLISIEKKYQNGETVKQVKSDPTKEALAKAKLKNASAREANAYMKLAGLINVETFKQVMYSKAAQALSGEMILPLPVSEKRTYTATEIGERLGISANMVGKMTNAHKLKTKEYGDFFHDKSKYSNKEVESFRYYDNVIPVLERLLEKEAIS